MAARKISNVTDQERNAAETAVQEFFDNYSSEGKVTEQGLKRFAADAQLIGDGLDDAAVGLIFQSVKVSGALNFDRFKEATRKLARKDEAEKKEKAQREHDREQKRITKKRKQDAYARPACALLHLSTLTGQT